MTEVFSVFIWFGLKGYPFGIWEETWHELIRALLETLKKLENHE